MLRQQGPDRETCLAPTARSIAPPTGAVPADPLLPGCHTNVAVAFAGRVAVNCAPSSLTDMVCCAPSVLVTTRTWLPSGFWKATSSAPLHVLVPEQLAEVDPRRTAPRWMNLLKCPSAQ